MEKDSPTDKLIRKAGVYPTNLNVEDIDESMIINFRRSNLAGKLGA